MTLKNAYLETIRAFPGGWDGICGAIGVTRPMLTNRIYEYKGQSMLVDVALQMQAASNTTYFAQAIAVASGGAFVKLPEIETLDRDDLLSSFNLIYEELGDLSRTFQDAIEDGEVDKREKHDLEAIAARIHQAVAQLIYLTLRLYCTPETLADDARTARVPAASKGATARIKSKDHAPRIERSSAKKTRRRTGTSLEPSSSSGRLIPA